MTFTKEIIVDKNKDLITVKTKGELDIYSTPEVLEDMTQVIEDHDMDLLLDMSELEYLDSSGLGALISVLKELKEKNKVFYIKGINPRIRNLFKITKIEDMFEFVGDN